MQLHSGFVSGNMSQKWSEEELEEILDDIPQHRMIEPCEIAHTCAYLYDPRAKSVTGPYKSEWWMVFIIISINSINYKT